MGGRGASAAEIKARAKNYSKWMKDYKAAKKELTAKQGAMNRTKAEYSMHSGSINRGLQARFRKSGNSTWEKDHKELKKSRKSYAKALKNYKKAKAKYDNIMRARSRY